MQRFSASTHRSETGFTLIEVLLVVIIAAVLAGIAAPSWLSFLNRQRVGSVKSDLIQTLRGAQQDAVQRRQNVTVEFTNTNGRPTMVINGVPQILGSDTNAGNIQLTSFFVNTAGTKTNRSKVRFDYQGLPIPAATGESEIVPFVISINATGSTTRQCVIVANLLGSLKTAENAECDNPQVGI